MLNSLRSWTQSWVVRGFFLLLAMSFGLFWGVQDIFHEIFESKPVAKIGSHAISAEEFHHYLRWDLQQTELLTGKPVPKEYLKDPEFLRNVLIQLVRNKLIEQEAERLGLVIPDEHLRHMVHESPLFRTPHGSFSHDRFQQFLQNQGMKERQFIHQLRQDLVRSYFIYTVAVPLFFVPKSYTSMYGHTLLEQRRATCFQLPYANQKVSTPSEEVLRDFLKTNEDQFVAPETRSGIVVVLDRRTFKSGQTPPLQEGQEAFEEELTRIEQDLDQGANLEEMRHKHPQAQVIPLTHLTAQSSSSLEPMLLKKVFETEFNQVSEALTLDKHRVAFIGIHEIKPSRSLTFEEARSQVLKAWTQHEQKKQAEAIAQSIQKTPETFKPVASQERATLREIVASHPYGTVLGLKPQASYQAQTPEQKNLLHKIFATLPRQVAFSSGAQGCEVCVVQRTESPSSWPASTQSQLQEWFKNQWFQDFMEAYIQHLAKIYKVKLYPQVLTGQSTG